MGFSPIYKARQKSGFVMLSIAIALLASNICLIVSFVLCHKFSLIVDFCGCSIVDAILFVSGTKNINEYKQYKFSYEQYVYSLLMTGQIDQRTAEGIMINENNYNKARGKSMINITLIIDLLTIIIFVCGIPVVNKFFDNSSLDLSEAGVVITYIYLLVWWGLLYMGTWIILFSISYIIMGIIKKKEVFYIHN